VQSYSDVIAGQFFGHAHTDSFRVIYDDNGTTNKFLTMYLKFYYPSYNRVVAWNLIFFNIFGFNKFFTLIFMVFFYMFKMNQTMCISNAKFE
jgi:hypothetical protein